MMKFEQDMLDRRRFLRQSFLFSAAMAMGPLGAYAAPPANPPATDAAHLLMLGDFGRETADLGPAPEQQMVAQGMISYTRRHNLTLQALLMLGDNFYGRLPGGADSPRWQSGFEQMYPKSVFNCPAYALLGNHEYRFEPASVDKAEACLAYARRGHTRWTMPSRWYSFVFPQNNPLITFIALDSNVYMEDGNGFRESATSFTLSAENTAKQLAWFKAELEKPLTTPYRIVLAHHPIYSNGPHGDHRILVRDWDPLLREHKVPFYLAGHDHDLQHLEFHDHPTSFFLSGGGGASLYNLKIEETQRGPWAEKVYGFSHLEVTPQLLTLRHLDGNGNILHTASKTPDGRLQTAS